jgi:hypothetical protein
MQHDTLADYEHTSLSRLKLAADIILSEGPDIPDPLTTELTLYRERIEHALLLPARPEQATQ